MGSPKFVTVKSNTGARVWGIGLPLTCSCLFLCGGEFGSMERRTFLSWFGFGLVVTSLPAALAACGQKTATPPPATTGNAPTPLPPPTGGDSFISVGKLAELQEKKGILARVGDRQVLVMRGGTGLVAVDPVCPHKQCTVNPQGDGLVCPCHGAQFNLDGGLVKGPANRGLQVFTAKEENGEILVRLG